ncbi:MAG: PDZ domain-containing protein, partial [Acidobacteria bacterium]|nr:PDZ domain-containing protein [Acidobacteriota bacterium]
IRSLELGSMRASFIGMDLVSGLCVLKAERPGLAPAGFYSPEILPARLDIRLYGFSPGQRMTSNASTIYTNPRRNLYSGQIVKAVGDFRYLAKSPIYYLTSPPLTAAQDGSLIVGEGNRVFGLVIYENTSSGKHLVYPISRIRTLAQTIINSRESIRYGWFGATGADLKIAPSSPILSGSTEGLGVRVVAVAPDSPADRAGLRPKDVITGVNDRRITGFAQLATVIRQLPPESEISVRVRRGAEVRLMRARLAPAPAMEPEQQLLTFARRLEDMERELGQMPPADPRRDALVVRIEKMRSFVGAITAPAPPETRLRVFYGLEVLPLTSQLMQFFAVNRGVLVTSNSAQREGDSSLRAGDVIVRAGSTEVTDATSLLRALEQPGAERVSLTIVRNREEQRVTISSL